MSTVAATLAHAWDHDLRPVFGIWNRQYIANPEHAGRNVVTAEFRRLPRIPVALLRQDAYVVQEPRGEPSPSALRHVPGRDRILDGLFRDEVYYGHHRDRLVDMFSPSRNTERRLRRTYGEVFEGTTVSISIRRGDFLKQRVLRRLDLELDWYRAALELIPGVDRVLVLSDDPAWCRDNAVFTANTYVVDSPGAHDDLYLMGACTHNIICNSSFAWWGAWLAPAAGRVVVQPARWFSEDFRGEAPSASQTELTSAGVSADRHTAGWLRL